MAESDRSSAEGQREEPSSIELLRRAREGDRGAVERIFERYLPVLRRWAAGRLPVWARDLVDTDDMIQDTVMRTFRGMDGFVPRHDGALAAYFRRVLDNRIRDELRNAGRRPRGEALAEDRAGSGDSPLESAIGAEAWSRYERALAKLSEDDRALVLSRIEIGSSYDEVARATGRPSANAARMAVSRALLKLAAEMDDA